MSWLAGIGLALLPVLARWIDPIRPVKPLAPGANAIKAAEFVLDALTSPFQRAWTIPAVAILVAVALVCGLLGWILPWQRGWAHLLTRRLALAPLLALPVLLLLMTWLDESLPEFRQR